MMSNEQVDDLDLENALNKTGYGKFHIVIFILFGAGYACIAMEMVVVSFIIPAAKCDFKMSSSDAGLLNAIACIGYIFGALFFGTIADNNGRKWTYSCSLFLAGFSALLSTISQSFYLFIFLRTANAFCIAGALSLNLTYLGEFQPVKYREKMLCFMELWWAVGLIIVPCIAWLVIPLEVRIKNDHFTYSSWNVYLACTAVPSMIFGVCSSFIPESPKFLLEIGKAENAFNVLKYMFSVNSGKQENQFLEGKLVSEDPIYRTVNKSNNFIVQLKTLFGKEYIRISLLFFFINYCLISGYYTLMLWFPEIFNRFEYFESLHPNKSTSVCEVSSIFLSQEEYNCDIDIKVFLNTIIIGLSCIPGSICLPFLVKIFGPKLFILVSSLISGSVGLGMYFVSSSLQNLILSCIFEAVISAAVGTLLCVQVEIFPTSIRAIAAGLNFSIGRLGVLISNLLFGYLIDLHCVIPLTVMNLLLFAAAIGTYFIPIRRIK